MVKISCHAVSRKTSKLYHTALADGKHGILGIFGRSGENGTSRRSLIFVWLIQGRFYATRIKSLIKNSPDDHAVTRYLVVYALMKSVCQGAVIAKMNLVYSREILKLVYFSENIVLESLTQT